MKPAVVLLSGGVDSATTLAIAKEEGYEVFDLAVGDAAYKKRWLHDSRDDLRTRASTRIFFGPSSRRARLQCH